MLKNFIFNRPFGPFEIQIFPTFQVLKEFLWILCLWQPEDFEALLGDSGNSNETETTLSRFSPSHISENH